MKKKIDFEGLINAIAVLVMLAIVFINVLSRKFIHISFSFAEEVVCVLFVLLSTVGAAAAARDESHYTLDLLTGALKPKTRNRVLIIDTIFSLIAAGVLVVTGVMMVMAQYKMGSTSDSLRFPEWIYGLTVPVGCGVMCIRLIQVVIRRIRKGE